MNSFINLGKYLFAVPFAIFGLFHFMGLEQMSAFAPGGSAGVILSGLGLVGASVSMLLGKYDKLATVLLAVMLLLFVALIHAKGAMAGDQMATSGALKDLVMAGASLIYAKTMARDNSIIG